MRGVDAFFLLHAIAAAVAVPGVEVVRCDFADGGVFGLNPVAEGYVVKGDRRFRDRSLAITIVPMGRPQVFVHAFRG